MAPIRIALIGLSSSAKTSWAAEGHLAYLLSPLGRSSYTIVALLNSTPAAALAARTYFNLPASVKTYGDPALLAADPSVDLVVCNTRVDVHAPTVAPSIAAGKAVFIEWPLAENYRAATALINARPNPTSKESIIGLQGRVSPPVRALKTLLGSGRIGRVLSSDISSFGSLLKRDELPEGLAYFAQHEVGGNSITIAYAHMIDYVHDVLGEFDLFESNMQVQRPELGVVGVDGARKGTVQSDVPDFITVHGRLKQDGRNVVDGATLAVVFRSGPPFKGAPGFVWTINGEKGEVRLTSPAGPHLYLDPYDESIEIEVHDHESNGVHKVDWDWEEWQKELPTRARGVAVLYERYARWVKSGKPSGNANEEQEWPRLDDAVVRLKEIDILFEQYDSKKK